MRKTPWLTEGAIEYMLKFLENEPRTILEFGMGSSTVWFKDKCKKIVSIDHNVEWYGKVYELVKDYHHVHLILRESFEKFPGSDELEVSYADEALKFDDETFDMVIIDGRNRVDCFMKSESKLKKGGLMVLDNSERPECEKIHEAYAGKQKFEFEQKTPDADEFMYPGWKTTCWVK